MLFGYTYAYNESDIEKLMSYVELMHSFFVDIAAPEMLVIQAYPWAIHLPILRSAYQAAKGHMEQVRSFFFWNS